jgi:hypothetical protein
MKIKANLIKKKVIYNSKNNKMKNKKILNLNIQKIMKNEKMKMTNLMIRMINKNYLQRIMILK